MTTSFELLYDLICNKHALVVHHSFIVLVQAICFGACIRFSFKTSHARLAFIFSHHISCRITLNDISYIFYLVKRGILDIADDYPPYTFFIVWCGALI